MKRVAVIGFGFMGFVHAQNILKSDKLKLAAIIDKDKKAVAQKIDNPDGNFSTGDIDVEQIKQVPVYENLENCLNTEQIDAVHICVHTNLHYAIAKQALNSGLHVLLEKPFVLNITEGEELIQLAKENKRVLMVAHVVRFMSPYKKLAQMVKNNSYGKLNFLSLQRFTGVPNWGQWKEKQKDFGSTGGALFDLVIHDIDFALFLLGQPDEIKHAILPGKLSKHDYLNAHWNYPQKQLAVKIEGGNIFHANFPFQAGFTAVFEKASVSFSSNDGDNIHIDTDE
jgi:predicted dehydrogenase